MKRLDSVSKSPVFSHLGETLNGISTIKAYKAEKRFCETIQNRIDENNIFYYPINVLERFVYLHFLYITFNLKKNIFYNLWCCRWLEIYLGIAGNLLVFGASIFAIIARDSISPGIAGLSLTYALNVSPMLNYAVKMTALLESNLTSVERVKEYWSTPQEVQSSFWCGKWKRVLKLIY